MILGRPLIGERVWDVQRCVDALTKYFSNLVDLDKIFFMGNSGGDTLNDFLDWTVKPVASYKFAEVAKDMRAH